MIDLRWVEYFVLLDTDTARIEKELQYREQEKGRDGVNRWSEWNAIPTIREEGYR